VCQSNKLFGNHTKVAPILGSAYRISAYRPTSACIDIGCFVTGMADNQLRMRKTDHCHMLIILPEFCREF